MTATPPRVPRETARVSTARGKWSVALAVGSAVVLFGGGFIAILSLAPFGGMNDPDYQAALAVAWIVLIVIAGAMVVAALKFGVTSVTRAWPQSGLPGRTTAIVLGYIGIGVG